MKSHNCGSGGSHCCSKLCTPLRGEQQATHENVAKNAETSIWYMGGSVLEYEKLIDLFDYALRMLYEKDHILLDIEAQERAVAGRLAIYLQHAFDPEFQDELCVDIEYNREGVEIKRRHRGDEKGWIAPDILLHRRTSVDKDNVFCCEVKQNEDEFNNDSDRVKDAVRERHYLFGVNLYSIQPGEAKLSVFYRKDGFVREEKYVFTRSGRKLIYRNQHRNWYCENNEWLYTV